LLLLAKRRLRGGKIPLVSAGHDAIARSSLEVWRISSGFIDGEVLKAAWFIHVEPHRFIDVEIYFQR
jgi:hypothetical protein